jgi:cytochrome c-type biogenesis protein CcmH/NrfG
METLDPFYLALLYFRVNKIPEAHAEFSKVLEKNPRDQVRLGLVQI